MDPIETLTKELSRSVRNGISRPPRSYREFLEECVTIPDGKYRNQRFRVGRQPIVGLWIDAIDSNEFNEYIFTAPSQFGKTLIAFIGPLLYHTCEIQENYVLGVPFADMISDKWDLDVKPVMRASPRLRHLLPKTGPGSAGGKIRERITLTNGVEIKPMSAGADDAGKAGFTSRVIGITEAARFSDAGTSSEEADPLRQLRARQRSYKDSERTTYIEGTVTIEEELPWTLKGISSDSRILCPCPHCEEWVQPERDDLIGWDAAKSENEAAELAFWACPNCGQKIDEDERRAAVLDAKLVHAGQEIDAQGNIVGEPRDTRRLFFRASAFHNFFLDAADIGKDEWLSAQIPEDSPERHSADRQLCQFVHSVPYEDPILAEDLALDKHAIGRRRLELPSGILPPDTHWFTLGVDVGEKQCWYCFLATREDAEGNVFRHVPMYGMVEVPSESMPMEQAIWTALDEVADLADAGMLLAGTGGKLRLPDQEWYDCNFQTSAVLGWVRKRAKEKYPKGNKRFQPMVGAYGRGATAMQGSQTRYNHKRKTSNEVRDIDPSGMWYLQRQAKAKTMAVYWDSDTTKWQVQKGLTLRKTGEGGEQIPGSLTLYAGTSKIHERFSRHCYNERLESVKTVRGTTKRWVRHGDNHLLDALAMAYRATDRAKHVASVNGNYFTPFRETKIKIPPSVSPLPDVSVPEKKASWYQ